MIRNELIKTIGLIMLISIFLLIGYNLGKIDKKEVYGWYQYQSSSNDQIKMSNKCIKRNNKLYCLEEANWYVDYSEIGE